MSHVTINYDFENSEDYTYDSDKIVVIDGGAKLLPVSNPSQTFTEAFTSSTGFTYDSDKTEFDSGVLQQKDKLPTNAVLWATYTSSKDLSYPTVSAVDRGTPVLSGGKLQCVGSNGVYYDVSGLSAAADTLSIKFKYTPQYTGSPATNYNIIGLSNGVDNINKLFFTHSPAGGSLRVFAYDSSGSVIHSAAPLGGAWSPTSGQEYEFLFVLEASTGLIRAFVDGVVIGSAPVTTFTRTNTATQFCVGAVPAPYNIANAYYDDVIIYSDVQETAGYVSGYSLDEARYLEDLVIVPMLSYSGIGSIQQFTSFTTTQTGSIRFNINNQYWNGSAWVVSDGSYSQMNDPSNINAAIINLLATDNITLRLITVTGNTQQDIDLLTVGYTGQIYSTDNPTIETIETFNATEIITFATVEHDVNGDIIKYTLKSDDVEYYWTGSAWAVSSGYSQSNTAIELNNAEAFNLSEISCVVYIHSADGSVTPIIEDIVVIYEILVPPDSKPEACRVVGYLLNPDNENDSNITVTAYPVVEGFILDKNFLVNVKPVLATFNAVNGFQLDLIRSAEYRNQIKYNVEIKSTDTNIEPIIYYNLTIPDSATANFDDLIST